ncbi:SCY1-like protein 2 [Sitodiplosis mosellana]|uniref:SCY1-like protein 2 n=1 Tax=Sitodiplosis mosellana TaxID=263140 RepID=UPI002443DA77|nr:SCY1-like protein 2 [Sitodiplosis mosellana]
MDVLNKFVNTVSSTVSQLSSVLPGNPVSKDFEIGEHIASAGPGLCWKVYKGTKRSTKQSVSVFVFDKNQLKYIKEDRDAILEVLKRGVIQLTKIRHPRVLTVQHPLEESRDSLAFVTESVLASLANYLGNYSNMPSPNESTQFPSLHEIEIKYGLMQLMEGLQFLHTDVKMIHRNICPESVVINNENCWKIFGFDYCCLLTVDQDTGKVGGTEQSAYIQVNRVSLLQPILDYSAPEWIIDSQQFCSSDVYSLGVLIYSIHSANKKPFKLFGTNLETYKAFAMDLKFGKYPQLTCIPSGIVDNVRLMLHYNPDTRPNLYELLKISYFDDFGVKTLSYLESLYQWDNLQKSKFFKGLPQILEKFPERLNRKQILPCLIKEFVNATMIPFVLPNVLLIAQNCPSQTEYLADIQRHLLPIMKIEQPIHILLIFMQNMELLIKLSTLQVIKNDLLSLCNRALECDVKEIQELCLNILPTMATHIDYAVLKNAIFPRLKKMCLTTQNSSVKVNSLICLGKLLEYFDKWFALDEIIPFLTQIPSRDPAVMMAIIGIFKLIMSHKKLGMTKEIMASKVIPFLVPLSIENGLTMQQFNAIMAMVKEIISTIETEHRARLEQLNSVRQDTKSIDGSSAPQSFPEFNLNDFKSSCLNDDKSAAQPAKNVNEVLLPSSMSMPSIAAAKPTPQMKNLTSTLKTNSITASPSFPTQLASNVTTMARSSNIPAAQSSLNLSNSNFLSGLGQISNAPKSVPMNQMMASTPFISSGPFQNSANSLSTLSPMIPNQSNATKKNGQDNTVALSAQEINDFLS